MDSDPWMHRCCVTGRTDGKIDWHHVYTFASKQISEAWAIIPLLRSVHDRVPADRELKDRTEWIALNRATDEQLRPYCKAIDYIRRREVLNRKFGGPYVGHLPAPDRARAAALKLSESASG